MFFDIQMETYKQIFQDFLEEAISAESRGRYGPAVSDYYKALTSLCSFLIKNKLQKTPKNHTEIFLFLKISFPDIYRIVNEVFTIYTSSYDEIMEKEDCDKIKNAIRQVAKISGIEKEFEEHIKKI